MAAKKKATKKVAKAKPAGKTAQVIDKREAKWSKQFDLLQKFREKFADRWPKSREEFPRGNNLGLWLFHQRESFARGTLPRGRANALKKVGVPLVLPDRWEEQFQNLAKYRKKNSKSWPKVREEFPEGNNIGFWCHKQRQDRKRGKLSRDKVQKLNKIKFNWTPRG